VSAWDTSSGQTLWSLAERWATVRSSEPALVGLGEDAAGGPGSPLSPVSWEQLATDVWELRRRLAALGVCDQRVVVMVLPNAPLTVALWLAVMANGAIVHAVDIDVGRLPLARAIRATDPAAVIAIDARAATVADAMSDAEVDCPLVVPETMDSIGLAVRAGPLSGSGAAGDPPSAEPDMVAGLLPTSGTSGPAKLVELTHRNYVMSGERLARNGGYLTDDRHFLCSPFFHTNAQLYLCAPPFITGGSIALVSRFSATHYFEQARRTGATVSSMVAPPMRMALHRAHERGGADAGALRLIQYGMTLSRADWEIWDRLLPQISMRQIYGQTESVTGVLGGSPWEQDDRETIGRPFLGVDAIRLVGEDGDPVGDGLPGELWVKGVPGNTLMRGYRGAPAETEEALVDGTWLRTGDIMVRRPSGRLEFRGRRMHIVRRGGESLSTYVLEHDLRACPLITDVAITAQTDAMLDATVVAHVIPSADYSEAGLRAWCREHLGKRGVPDHVRVHERFPRTASGRVILREL
jgi:crotonobetaine/carnitine-CoA ligase